MPPLFDERDHHDVARIGIGLDAAGQLQAIHAGQPGAHQHQIRLDQDLASRLPSGIYLYRLESGNYISAKKFILLK